MKKINLLVLSKLIEPLCKSKSNLEIILTKIENNDQVILNGLFAMCISYFEYALNDMLYYFFKCFPEKLDFKALSFNNSEQSFMKSIVSFNKEDIFNTDLVELEIEKKIEALSYSTFKNYINNFFTILSIDVSEKDYSIDTLLEYKETRNLLIHNNLVVNYKYLNKTGTYKRGYYGDSLRIDKIYIDSCIKYLLNFMDIIIEKLNVKYKEYTRLKALENLWYFMFNSPVMKFENYWKLDIEHDCIQYAVRAENKENLSTTEQIKLGVWRAHYTGNSEDIKNFNMYNIDNYNREKVLYFLSILDFIDLQAN